MAGRSGLSGRRRNPGWFVPHFLTKFATIVRCVARLDSGPERFDRSGQPVWRCIDTTEPERQRPVGNGVGPTTPAMVRIYFVDDVPADSPPSPVKRYLKETSLETFSTSVL